MGYDDRFFLGSLNEKQLSSLAKEIISKSK
jgi:hypothetical protein